MSERIEVEVTRREWSGPRADDLRPGKPKSATKKGKKPFTIEEHGISVRVFLRGETWWLDVREDVTGKRERRSAKTTDRGTAEDNARKLAGELARQTLLGVTADTLTLAQLFAAYQEHKGAKLEGQWEKASERRQRLFVNAWGASLPVVAISQTSVDEFASARRKAYVEKQRKTWREQQQRVAAYAAAQAKGQPMIGRPPKTPVTTTAVPEPTFRTMRDGALDADFRWLSSVFNWAMKHKLSSGKRLLTLNPLHDCKWPREKNVLRPVAAPERYTRTLEHVGEVDAMGRLRLALALARFTARRIDAILHLRASDLLLTPARVRAGLAEAGKDESTADAMAHGAIRWRDESDKQGIDRVTPISKALRAEIDTYLAANPKLGDAWLFPHIEQPVNAPEVPLTRAVATKWLLRAERLADLPKLRRGLWHPYRRLWSTERKHLPDVDVAEAGGWNGTKAMKLAYQTHTPAGVLAVVNAQ